MEKRMHDRQLRREFIRLEHTDGSLRILVGSIQWDGPAHPTLSWSVACELPGDSFASVVDEEIAAILTSPDYFAVCAECGERKPLGWMHDSHICQACAERDHGVVY
jgi:hypothetical protein